MTEIPWGTRRGSAKWNDLKMLQVKQSAALPAPLIVALLLCALIIQTQQQIDNAAKAQRVHEPRAAATRAVVNNATVETRSGK